MFECNDQISKLCVYVCIPNRKKHINLGDPVAFPVAQSSSQLLSFPVNVRLDHSIDSPKLHTGFNIRTWTGSVSRIGRFNHRLIYRWLGILCSVLWSLYKIYLNSKDCFVFRGLIKKNHPKLYNNSQEQKPKRRGNIFNRTFLCSWKNRTDRTFFKQWAEVAPSRINAATSQTLSLVHGLKMATIYLQEVVFKYRWFSDYFTGSCVEFSELSVLE